MAAGSPGQPPSGDIRQRFDLPDEAIAPGRSQPKRLPPKRYQGGLRLARRIALGAATFAVALGIVSTLYGLLVAPDFGSLSFENGTTAAVALLIGCFALPSAQRIALSPRRNLWVCLAVIALTPWTYQLGNRLEDAGMDLATGFNFLFEIALAVVLYRLAARQPKRPSAD